MKAVIYITGFVIGLCLCGTAQVLQIDRSLSISSKNLGATQSAQFADPNKSVWNLNSLQPDSEEVIFFKNPSYGSIPALSSVSSLLMDTEAAEYYVDLIGSLITVKVQVPYDPLNLGWTEVGRTSGRHIMYPSFNDLGFELSSITEIELDLEQLPVSVRAVLAEDIDLINFQELRDIRVVPEGSTTLVIGGRRKRLSRFKKTVKSRFQISSESSSEIIDVTDILGERLQESIVLMKENNELPLAELFLSEPVRMVWQNAEVNSSKSSAQKSPLTILPNPSFGEAEAVVHVTRPGSYSIVIKSVIGKRIQEYEALITDSKRIDLHFSQLNKGSYICSLIDEQGRTIQSRKLILLKP